MSAMVVHFNNYSKKVGRRGTYDWYQWKVFVDEDNAVLDKIDYVTYYLHPTFSNPVRTITDKGSKFELESSGWGSFTMTITIRFKDGTEKNAKYFLDISKGWPI